MRNKKLLIHIIRISIIISLLSTWELLSKYNIINSFIFSSPSKILKCINNLWNHGNLINHIIITLKEIIISFSLSIIIGFLISIVLYEFNMLYLIIDPLLTILNSTPKVALGPLIIIIFGASTNSIIIMALSITLIVNILSIYNGFTNTNKYLNLYLDINGANRINKLRYLVIPSGITSIINSLKINISLTLIGLLPLVGEKIFFNKCYSRY